jgi:hypothetical protein
VNFGEPDTRNPTPTQLSNNLVFVIVQSLPKGQRIISITEFRSKHMRFFVALKILTIVTVIIPKLDDSCGPVEDFPGVADTPAIQERSNKMRLNT